MNRCRHSRLQRTLASCRFIDWVVSWPDHDGRVTEQFFRGEIASVRWKHGLPVLRLLDVREYQPLSANWLTANAASQEYFDFSALRSRQIHYSLEVVPCKRIRFSITLSMTGIMLPLSKVNSKHFFASDWGMPLEVKLQRLLLSIESLKQ